MAALIIVYFHRGMYIFFCVRIHHDCCHARALIFCIEVRSLWEVCRKDTNVHVG
jgi:hypothetical protein